MKRWVRRVRHWLEAPERFMVRYLERRGWVVIYIQSECRSCTEACWLEIYTYLQRGGSKETPINTIGDLLERERTVPRV